MLGWSLPAGKIFGVEVRLHSFFVFFVVVAVAWAAFLGGNPFRGVVLWLLVLLAVLVRESARALAAAWFSLELRSVMLLPTGAIVSYGSAASLKRVAEADVQRTMALTGPVANVVFGLALAGAAMAIAPGVILWQLAWVSPLHLVRAAVWVNLLLAAVNLLPAWPLDAGRVVQGEVMRSGGNSSLRTFTRVGPAMALALVGVGIGLANFWLITIGLAVLIGAQAERQGLLVENDAEMVRVKDVMLREYSILSASATLEDAVVQARQTLQDVFPVVRAGNLVGAVGRTEILQAIAASGNGYVQGVMARTFETAGPEDSLVETLARVTGGSAGTSSQLVPVLEGERVVGIITPQNLRRSMRLVMRKSVPGARSAGAGSDSEAEDERD